jgi:hypothetical protein
VLREEDEEAFLFNPETGAIKVLNPTGTFICKLCDGTNDTAGIITKILESFEAEEENVKKDLDSFLEKTKEMGFVE